MVAGRDAAVKGAASDRAVEHNSDLDVLLNMLDAGQR
jgi:hypothetical protein